MTGAPHAIHRETTGGVTRDTRTICAFGRCVGLRVGTGGRVTGWVQVPIDSGSTRVSVICCSRRETS